MGIFPVEFPTTTADSFESFRVLHYLAFIKEEDVLIETGLFTTEDAAPWAPPPGPISMM